MSARPVESVKGTRAMTANSLSDVRMQVMWNRLISVVEEQAVTLIRTAFSTSVRESGDLSAGVFNQGGKMIAQAVTGTPGHVNAMAEAVGHFIQALGPDPDCFECFPIRQIVDQQHAVGPMYVIQSNAPKSFLACSIPNL